MDSGISDLIGLVGTPRHPRARVAVEAQVWADVEYRLGLPCPPDFKQLLATFGEHAWGGFLWVLSPSSSNENLHLERRGHRLPGALHELRRKDADEIPFALYPETSGLLPWGVTDNGDMLLWLTQGPAHWWPTIIVEARGPHHERHQFSATQLLARFLQAELESRLLLELFEGEAPLDSDPGWAAESSETSA